MPVRRWQSYGSTGTAHMSYNLKDHMPFFPTSEWLCKTRIQSQWTHNSRVLFLYKEWNDGNIPILWAGIGCMDAGTKMLINIWVLKYTYQGYEFCSCFVWYNTFTLYPGGFSWGFGVWSFFWKASTKNYAFNLITHHCGFQLLETQCLFCGQMVSSVGWK